MRNIGKSFNVSIFDYWVLKCLKLLIKIIAYGVENQGFESRQRDWSPRRNCLCGPPSPLLYQMDTGSVIPRIKRLKREADSSPLSSVEESYFHAVYTLSWRND
jgi:hypothetical protein